MTANAISSLTSPEEDQAVLVPCYGFSTRAEGLAFRESDPDWTGDPISRGSKPSSKAYVPRRMYTAGGNATDFTDTMLGRGKPVWQVLRQQDLPKPVGAYNVALVVEGKRRCLHDIRAHARHSGWWLSLMEGWRDCYVAWETSDKAPIFEDAATDKRIYAVRRCRGVIYTENLRYDQTSGEVEGTERVVVRAQFEILDYNPKRGDIMKLTVSRRTSMAYADMPDFIIRPNEYEEGWQALVNRARSGYAKSCRPLDPEKEEWRVWFVAQRRAAENDRRDTCSFRSRTRDLGWAEALDQAQTAWQLEVVIHEHAHQPAFYQHPAYSGSKATMVRNMLTAYYGSSDERANRQQELEQWLANFVIPRDRLWNYTGD